MATETLVSYVIEVREEVRRGTRPWIPMSILGDSEGVARTAYDDWLVAKRQNPRSVLRYRMVRRTAVVTDEVLVSEWPDEVENQE